MVGAEELDERVTDRAEELLADMRTHTSEHKARVTTEYVFGKPADESIEYVNEHDIDLIIMGSHSRTGLIRVLLGSVAQSVLKRAPVPVTIIR